jgi:hypothetical protein
MHDLVLELFLFGSLHLLFVAHPLKQALLIVLLVFNLLLFELPLLSELSVEDFAKLLLLSESQGGLSALVLIVLLFLILNNLNPLILREVARKRLGLGCVHSLVPKFQTQICEMLMVLREGFNFLRGTLWMHQGIVWLVH